MSSELEPRRQRNADVELFVNLLATAEDHVEVHTCPITMVDVTNARADGKPERLDHATWETTRGVASN